MSKNRKPYPALWLVACMYVVGGCTQMALGVLKIISIYDINPWRLLEDCTSMILLCSILWFKPKLTGAAISFRIAVLSATILTRNHIDEALWQVQLPVSAVAFICLIGMRGSYLSSLLLLYSYYRFIAEKSTAYHHIFMSSMGVLFTIGALGAYLKRLELAREKLSRESRAKEAFLSQTSHELRTPIAIILQYIEVLGAGKQYDQEAVDAMTCCARSALMLISDILSWTRISSSGKLEFNPARFRLSGLASEIESMSGELVRKKSDQVQFIMQFNKDDSTIIYLDKGRLVQVVNGLVTNSLKFTKSGSIACSLKCQNGHLCISVTDTGKGFPSTKKDLLFHEFYKESHGQNGVGLGLSIAKAICTQMEGTISAYSKGPGHGAKFSISIPLEESTAPGNPAFLQDGFDSISSSGSSSSTGERHTVLLVEDNSLLRKVLKRQLGNLGLKVIAVGDALEAIKRLDNTPIDAVVVDMLMPWMTGIELTALIRSREELKALWIVGASALTDSKHSKSALRAGMNAYLTKPVTQEKLREALIKFL